MFHIFASGSLPNLTELFINSNKIGDSGLQAFASAVASGSLPQLQLLQLNSNSIGDGGMQAFASAVASGSLASLKMVMVDDKYTHHLQLKAACQARGIRLV